MSAFVLKLIACAVMLTDHIGAVFSADTPFILREIGRIAFPIFAYLIAQGCKYTKNIYQYMLRLGIFALISEIPFDLAFDHFLPNGTPGMNIHFFSYTNVYYTLFLGVAAIAVYEKLKTTIPKFFALIPAVLVSLLADILSTDYGMYGVLFILVFYFAKPENRITRTLAMLFVVFVEYGYPYFYTLGDIHGLAMPLLPGQLMVFTYDLHMFWFALAAVPLVFLYNGKQGPKLKWAFYAFYPVHLAILAAIWFGLYFLF